MSKRYRLLKDLPNAKAGTVLQGYNTMSYTYRGKDDVVYTYHKSFVENNTDWFEEITESHPSTEPMKEDEEKIDPIEIAALIEKYKEVASKFPKYKLAAIEQVLNDEFISIYGNYTQEYLDNAIENAFNAARVTSCNINEPDSKKLHSVVLSSIKDFNTFKTFQDYKQSLSSPLEEKEQPSTFTTSIDEILNFCKEKGFYFGDSHLEIIKQLAKSKT